MKFLSCALGYIGLTTLTSAASISAPLEKRDITSEAYDLINTLLQQVLVIDAEINSTAAGLNAASTVLENATVLTVFETDIQRITDLFNAAATAAPNLPLTKRDAAAAAKLATRQAGPDVLDLADLLVTLLEEIDSTINPLLVNLGLGPLVNGLLVPLEDALGSLVGAASGVVDGLVAALLPLLDAITKAVGAVLGAVLGLLGLQRPTTPRRRPVLVIRFDKGNFAGSIIGKGEKDSTFDPVSDQADRFP